MPADYVPAQSVAGRAIFGDPAGWRPSEKRAYWLREQGYDGPIDKYGDPTDLTMCEGCRTWVDETRTDCTNAELCKTCMHDHEAECRRCADPEE
jgi:hypothetical protein